MTSYGKTVLWLGLILIVLNISRHWSSGIRGLLFTKSKTSSASPFGSGVLGSFASGFGSSFGLPLINESTGQVTNQGTGMVAV